MYRRTLQYCTALMYTSILYRLPTHLVKRGVVHTVLYCFEPVAIQRAGLHEGSAAGDRSG